MTDLIRHFKFDINIIQGKISQTQKGSYGTLFVHIDGDAAEVQEAVEFLHQRSVGVEVITNA